MFHQQDSKMKYEMQKVVITSSLCFEVLPASTCEETTLAAEFCKKTEWI